MFRLAISILTIFALLLTANIQSFAVNQYFLSSFPVVKEVNTWRKGR